MCDENATHMVFWAGRQVRLCDGHVNTTRRVLANAEARPYIVELLEDPPRKCEAKEE